MGWIISAGKLSSTGFEPGRNAGVITSPTMKITSTPCPSGAQWRFIPNADRITSEPWQAHQTCQQILSMFVGAI
jgi:hypothetical protein